MYVIDPFAISGILILITYLPLCALIFVKGPSKATRMYGLHLLAVSGWGLGSILLGTSNEPSTSLAIWKYS